MTFDEKLLELMTDQEQLRAMKTSCKQFESKLNEKISKFLSEELNFEESENFSMLDLVARAKRK